MIISVINAKGGVGKTTTAIYLATALASEGWPVVVYDLDAQGSATNWHDRAEEAESNLRFPVKVTNGHRLHKDILKEGPNTVIVLDTPPGESKAIEAAIELSTFVVVPTQASAIEIERVWETLPSLTQVAHGVLITSARLGTKHLSAAQEVLKENGIPMFETVIPIRNDIREHYGKNPGDLHGYESVIQEIKKVISWP